MSGSDIDLGPLRFVPAGSWVEGHSTSSGNMDGFIFCLDKYGALHLCRAREYEALRVGQDRAGGIFVAWSPIPDGLGDAIEMWRKQCADEVGIFTDKEGRGTE